ncbi:uncharacterized protein [Gossypium hirsutum]|uniref:Retrovirus-related Pol polyprotein from transposon TNT 1-94-like beta-barrel domain-containing protein n=1 Tax=Gossypium hirsutum TaxID=3635 RepID=A0A1U8LH10_GOSHI|nr:uncharacterized protein LOC107927380 [Gossypium hirsutum]
MALSGFSPAAPPVFNGEGYHIWVVKMRTYLQTFDLCENCVSDVIFTRIMACETPKQAWDKLKEEFQRTERTRQQQLLNLRREFENLKMKEEETVKKYSDRIMAVVNSIRLLGEHFSEARIVEKVLSTLPERYESKGGPADRRSTKKVPFKSKPSLPRAPFLTKARIPGQTSLKQMVQEDIHPVHTAEGQVTRPRAEAQVVEEDNDQEEQVFAVSCSAVKGKATDGWLIDSGCTNHITPDASIFKSIDRSFKTNVKVGNGHFIKVEGKGDVLISTLTGTKLVKNVLLVPEIDRNLLSIAQLLEKGYSVVFKGKECLISDPSGSKLMTVAMTEKSFIVDWNKSPDSAYTAAADESKLCHKRLSHANYMSMAQLTKEDSVENFTNSVEKERKFLTLKEVHDMHGNQTSAQIKELEAPVTSLELELKSLQAINRDMAE